MLEKSPGLHSWSYSTGSNFCNDKPPKTIRHQVTIWIDVDLLFIRPVDKKIQYVSYATNCIIYNYAH